MLKPITQEQKLWYSIGYLKARVECLSEKHGISKEAVFDMLVQELKKQSPNSKKN
ncbi:hypothetical protein B0I26_10374 [Anoxybacillus vitaminiphilus]|uniref:Uncharacterized protein n=1 Tax=Paranoxybacillus vitaminiphilus TaxID=581036 RepID=A0A327YL36_9BACL|nr:hypothetical protein [Anoxybacillus vitaminiphilus]RAK21122.1 hypothetical protein B0I26_10374 [Anoxybacillus vitaminiphilus]